MAVLLAIGLALGAGVTVLGVVLRDGSAHGSSVAAESVRNAGIAIVGGVTVGGFVSLVQRAIAADAASRADDNERRRNLDLVVATSRDLQTIDLAGARLAGRYLAGKDLSMAELGDADLTGANLHGAVLRDARLVGADLRGADLTGADLTGADLTGADLTGADLTGATLGSVISDGTTTWPEPGGPG